jgi:hypothetical protein
MLDRKLWTSFDKELDAAEIQYIENRILFLKEILEDAKNQYSVQDVSSDLDLDVHQYLNYSDDSSTTRVSPWLIHDAWLYYHDDGLGLNPEIRVIIVSIFNESNQDLYFQIINLLKCIGLVDLIASEADAVVVLSFMDYLATQMLYVIGQNRFKKVLQLPDNIVK